MRLGEKSPPLHYTQLTLPSKGFSNHTSPSTLWEPLSLARPTPFNREGGEKRGPQTRAPGSSPRLPNHGTLCTATSASSFRTKGARIIYGFVGNIQDYTPVKSPAACLAHSRGSLKSTAMGTTEVHMETTHLDRDPSKVPSGGGWEGAGGESLREETVARKRKREAELEVTSGEGREGLGDAHTGWGPQLRCLSAASSSGKARAHLTSVPAPALLPGPAALTTTTTLAAPSAARSCLIFLPAPDTGSSCPPLQPP